MQKIFCIVKLSKPALKYKPVNMFYPTNFPSPVNFRKINIKSIFACAVFKDIHRKMINSLQGARQKMLKIPELNLF